MSSSFSALIAFGLLLPLGTQPQPPPLPSADSLSSISGQVATVRYEPGFLDRAEHVLRRTDLLAIDLGRRGKRELPLTTVVLSRAQWEAASLRRPYGLPIAVSSTTVVVPALGDRGTVELWERWLGSDLPPLKGHPLRGTAEEASSLVLADILFQREVAGLFVVHEDLAIGQPWTLGVLAHLTALTLFSRYESGRLVEIQTVYHRLNEQMPMLLKLDRDSEQRLTREWLRAQAAMFQVAFAIFEVHGEQALSRVLKARKRNRGPLAAEQLLELFPELRAWLEKLEARSGNAE